MRIPGNVFLIGPMGAGKSTIGRHLAELLGKQFVDADQELEQHTGVSIALIFEIEGEAGFRKRESALLDELTRRQNIVLATGGGAILWEENRALLRARGTVVYLDADIDTLAERTRRDRNRPLLQTENRRARLAEIMHEREPLYRQQADVIIPTSRRSPATVARRIAAALQARQVHENA